MGSSCTDDYRDNLPPPDQQSFTPSGQDEEEKRAWVRLARKARKRWQEENPYEEEGGEDGE